MEKTQKEDYVEIVPLLLEEKVKKKSLLTEEVAKKDITHFCATHVKEHATGREGKVTSHSLLEDGTVDFYNVDFGDEVVENIHVSELDILEGNDHSHKRDPEEEEEGEEEKTMEEAFTNRYERINEALMKKWFKK